MKLLVILFFARSLNIFVSSCEDITIDVIWNDVPWFDYYVNTCEWYEFEDKCSSQGHMYENHGMTANEACCICGGGFRNPTTSPSPTLSPQPSASPTLSTQPSSSPTSWYSKNSRYGEDDPTTTVLAILGAIVALWLVIGCIKVYAKNSSRNSNNNAARPTNLRTRPYRPTQSAPQQTQHAGSSIVDERDVRRQFILRNIIHKVSSYDYCMHLNMSHIQFTFS